MIVGVPKEIKTEEYRIAMTPAGAREFVQRGHVVLVEKEGGSGLGVKDDAYTAVGAEIVETAGEVFQRADMLVKVKEPQPSEFDMLREGQILYTYLHLAASEKLTRALARRKIIGIAYETVELADGSLPLLAPMSEVAGRMAPQEAARFIERPQGGRGVLFGGVPGTPPARVVVLGGGIVGTSAAKVAAGMGAEVWLLDNNLDRLRYLDDVMAANVNTLYSTSHSIEELLPETDVLIGAVLITGAKAPKLVTRPMLKRMPEGSVYVDVSIDQGGTAETSRPTTHDQPTYVEEGVVHYCVANMPGAVPRTSTYALSNATLSYGLALADKGWRKAVEDDPALAKGVNLCNGGVTYEAVAKAFGMEYVPLQETM